MNRVRLAFLTAIIGVTGAARAEVDLVWRVENPNVGVGDVVRVGLYAVADNPNNENEAILTMQAVVLWDAGILRLLGNDDNGPYEWMLSGFFDDSGMDGLNETFDDGDALYAAASQFGNLAEATPDEGLLVTTLEFEVLETTPVTVTIVEVRGEFSESFVIGEGVQRITGDLGQITIPLGEGCGDLPGDLDFDGDVDIVDFNAFASCFTGSGGGVPDGCECADLDGDGDVDIVDFNLFAGNFTGSR